MKVISTEIKDGYKIDTYDNGAVVKVIYIDKPTPEPAPELSATEQAIFEAQVNTEYLVALKELEV